MEQLSLGKGFLPVAGSMMVKSQRIKEREAKVLEKVSSENITTLISDVEVIKRVKSTGGWASRYGRYREAVADVMVETGRPSLPLCLRKMTRIEGRSTFAARIALDFEVGGSKLQHR